MGITLSDEQIAQFETFYRELLEWNEKFNLTAITRYEDVQAKHFLDSLTITGELADADDKTVIDVGTGGGMPGIPLKIALPGLNLTLLEATGKKTLFLKHVLEVLEIEDVGVITGRSEEIAHRPEFRQKFDYVIARAVAPLNTLAELVLPLCAVGGICIAPKKGDIRREMEYASRGIEKLGGVIKEIKPVCVPGDDDDRCLVILVKTKETPEQFPRRSGLPSKRPLT